MAIVMNGLNMNAQSGGSFWLYDTATGLNVSIAKPIAADFASVDFSSTDFSTGGFTLVEYQNLSQKP